MRIASLPCFSMISDAAANMRSTRSRLRCCVGIPAMQSVNVTILSGTFLSLFMGTALISAALIVTWFLGWVPSGGVLLLAASVLYLVGVFGVTMVFNVPMNDALAAMEPGSAEAA